MASNGNCGWLTVINTKSHYLLTPLPKVPGIVQAAFTGMLSSPTAAYRSRSAFRLDTSEETTQESCSELGECETRDPKQLS